MDRSQIVLNDIIGVGQFGDVHIGLCKLAPNSKPNHNSIENSSQVNDSETLASSVVESERSLINVAIKTCKADADLITSEKFLEEAYIMQKFEHPHIIRLIGICSGPPIWIVMVRLYL